MNAPTIEDALELPVTFDLPTACSFFGIGRDGAYAAYHRGELPFDVIKVGRRLVVTRAALLAALGIDTGVPRTRAHGAETSETPEIGGAWSPDPALNGNGAREGPSAALSESNATTATEQIGRSRAD